MSTPSPIPPLSAPPAARPVRPAGGRTLPAGLGSYVAVNSMLIAIWAASGAGYFWPIWPILGWGLGLLSGASPWGTCGGRVPPRTSRGQESTTGPQDVLRR